MLHLLFACCVFLSTTVSAQQSTGKYLPVDTFRINEKQFLDTGKRSCNTHAVLKKIDSQNLNRLAQDIKAIPQVTSVSVVYNKKRSDFFAAYDAYNDRELVAKMYETVPSLQFESFKGCPLLPPVKTMTIINH